MSTRNIKFKASAAAKHLGRGPKSELYDATASFLTTLQAIARGRKKRGPLDAEVARQMARQALTTAGEAW